MTSKLLGADFRSEIGKFCPFARSYQRIREVHVRARTRIDRNRFATTPHAFLTQVVLEEDKSETLKRAGKFAKELSILSHAAAYFQPERRAQKINCQGLVAILQQLFDHQLVAEQKVMDQMIVKRLGGRQLLQRALKQRNRHLCAFTVESLDPEIILLLEDAVEISPLWWHVDRLDGLPRLRRA